MHETTRSKAKLLPSPLEIRGAPVVSGAGRGKKIGIPTVNLNLKAAPSSLEQGVYACRIFIKGKRYMGAMHFGPRPVFSDSDSFEVYVLDTTLTEVAETVDLTIVAKIREIQNFPSAEILKTAIADDVRAVRAILKHA
jgi:riboflavin kinase/FMN adenylyltransferase